VHAGVTRTAMWLSGAVFAASACGGAGSGGPPSSMSPSAVPITSEADALLHMDQLRAMGFRGGGIRVGVISTGVVNLAAYQAAGLLPAAIYVSQNTAGSLDEGSWMLELVHQHAPDAALGFCDGNDLDFDGCIKDLADSFHADIVVDDLLYSGQFYPGATADAVMTLESTNDKFLFVHLSGNEQNGGYWQGAFVPVAAEIAGAAKTALDFGAASSAASDPYNAVAVPAGKRLVLILNWNDPPHTAGNRAISAYLLGADSQVLAQISGQADPTLELNYTNSSNSAQTVRLMVSLDAGAAGGLQVQVMEGSRTCNIECQTMTYSTSGSAGGTVGDFDDALVVGATFSGTPHVVEPWSNHGPFRIDFSSLADAAAADGYDYTRLATPLLVMKPDLVAPDCVTTPFFENGTMVNRQFCGTSAASPSIAGAAALLESAGFNRTQVLKSLRDSAVPLNGSAWDPASGHGLADVAAAYASGGK
jgi:hypothetical protein